MVMSTPTLDRAAHLVSVAILIDTLDLYNVGEPVTTGINVSRELTLVQADIPSLVQGTLLANAVESATETTYSVKVSRDTVIKDGQAIKVKSCAADPSLVGKTLYLDKVSQNGAALIRKAVASTSYNVDQQGKEGLS
mgnify:CR=1 FL=1